MPKLKHCMLVKYYEGGNIKMGNYVPDDESDVIPMEKVEKFVLLSNIVKEMMKDEEVRKEMEKWKRSEHESDETGLAWHRYIEKEASLLQGKVSSSPEATTGHINKEAQIEKERKLWLPHTGNIN